MFERRDATLGNRRDTVLFIVAVLTPIVVVAIGSLIRPDIFYDRFFWQYFYGPIQADSQGGTITRGGVTASPGYTLVSSAVYTYYLLLAVVGSVSLLNVFDVGNEKRFFYALVPYGFLGGALRVVEDTGSLEEPLAYFFISPVIYMTMYVFTAVFVTAVVAERRGVINNYAVPVAVTGAAVVATAGYLLVFGASSGSLALWVPVTVVGAATVVGTVIWLPLGRFAPWINDGTGLTGAVLLWSHLADGFSTVVGVEYLGYSEKQPIVGSIIDVFGTTYAFVAVKAGIVLLILYAFDDEFFKGYERLPYILLVAVLAVGLGPGTRNTLRMTLGV